MACRAELTGGTYGRLTVLGYSHSTTAGGTHWHCRCECGTVKVIRGVRLTNGVTTSCGCYHRERVSEAAKRRIKHGWYAGVDVDTPEGRSYRCMMQRCHDENHKGFPYYGGAGVVVCERWIGPDGYSNFCEDMGPPPAYEACWTVDRKDSTKNYTPDNCQWMTKPDNSRKAGLERRRRREMAVV
jgi:hypothetical protein